MTNNASPGHSKDGYTVYTLCPACGKELKGKRPQAKFCSPHCRFDFHNKRKRPEIENPPTAATGAGSSQGGGISETTASNITKTPSKLKRVLAELASGHSFNRFEAERVLSDHCLHSTVSSIQKHGITVNRRTETVPGYQGIATHVCRYWLVPEEREKAAILLGWQSHGKQT